MNASMVSLSTPPFLNISFNVLLYSIKPDTTVFRLKLSSLFVISRISLFFIFTSSGVDGTLVSFTFIARR